MTPTETNTAPGSQLPFVLSGVIVVIAVYGAYKWWQVEQARVDRSQAIAANEVGPPLTEFELTERIGQTFRSADMRGDVWVVTYFFTSCPGSCIRLNQNIQFLHNQPELADVTWVSITVDPVTDSLPVLRDYAERMKADSERWLFCRGELDYIKQIGAGMKLPIFRQGHKDYAVVFDKAGKLRGMFDATRKSETERLQTLLLKCMKEPWPPAKVTHSREPTACRGNRESLARG